MEEVSFRAGAAVAGGVLTVAGVAITLAVVPSGHRDAAAITPARVAAPSLAPPPVAPVSSVPSPTPRPSRTTTRATAAGTYQPPSAARPATARPAAVTPALGRTPTPRLREARSPWRRGVPHGYWRSHRPRPWLFGLLWHRRPR
ncbi:MAG TPA: hypothetical protein VGF32_19845 [Streptosporangiaceae bacterium]